MKFKKLAMIGVALVLPLSACAAPSTFDGYVHVECDPVATTAAGKVTECRSTEMPIPTVTVTPSASISTPTTSAEPTAVPTTATPSPTATVSPSPTPTQVTTVTKVNDSSFTYTGSTWNTSSGNAAKFQGDNHWGAGTNIAWTYTFTGTKIQWYAEKSANLGIVAVSIDGGAETLVDPYASTRSEQNLLYTSPTLTNAQHIIKVRSTGTKNPSAGGVYVSTDRVDVTTISTSAPTPTTPPNTSGVSFKFAAVGDMNNNENSSMNTFSGKNSMSIQAGLNDGSLDAFLGIGDFQYSYGTCSALVNYWNKVWGPVLPKTYWAAGPVHDVDMGYGYNDLGKFMNGQCSGSSTKSATNITLGKYQDAMEWYSFTKGNWHIQVAPTATWRYNSTRAKAMTAEMDADLKKAKAEGKFLAVMYHDPYFTSKTSSHTRETAVKPWVDMWWNNRVKVLLSGSQHNYERSCPVNNVDQCVPDGMQQFQVSTGGKEPLRPFMDSPGYIVKRFSDTHGHIRMTLNNDGSYSWNYVPVGGAMQTDSGTRQ